MYEYYQEPEDPSQWPYYVVLFVIQAIGFSVLSHFMSQAAERVSGDLRTISPAHPWLSVIPFFGSFWIFYVVQQLGNMLREEFSRRKIVEFETTPGLIAGWGFSFTILVAQLTLLVDVPAFTILLYLAAAVQLILYAVKLSGLRAKLESDLFAQSRPPFPENNYSMPHHNQPQFHQPPPPPSVNIPPPPPQPYDWERWKPK